MRIENEAPELTRLRRAMRIEWNEYLYWRDNSIDRICAIEQECYAAGDESFAPLVRAQYIHEMWWSWS